MNKHNMITHSLNKASRENNITECLKSSIRVLPEILVGMTEKTSMLWGLR